MITVSGISVYPDEGCPSLYDIGWGLARLGRFANMCEKWYSVLAHTYTVAALVEPEFRIHALLHDAAEAILGDQVATWKNKDTERDERDILYRIYKENNIGYGTDYVFIQKVVLKADLAARVAEARLLGHASPELVKAPDDLDESMLEEAMDYTALHLENFTPNESILHTAALAQRYESAVKREVSKYNVAHT